MLVSQVAQTLHKCIGCRTHATFTLNWFDKESSGLRADRGLCTFQIIKLYIFESIQKWGKALVHFLLIGSGNSRHCAAVKRVLERDDFKPFASLRLMIGTRSFDRTFNSFGAAIGKEYCICKGRINQPLCKFFALWATI